MRHEDFAHAHWSIFIVHQYFSCFGFENGPNQDGRGGFYENSRKDKTGALSALYYFLPSCVS
jgi:hypothetical protein